MNEKNCKIYQPNKKIVKSLINLRNELYANGERSQYDEIFFKINSCLFSEYPIKYED